MLELSESVVLMSPQEWWLVPDNPVQRDTQARVKQAVKNHLKEYKESHKFVTAIRRPNGSLVKADGHTRALAQKMGLYQGPQQYIVNICEAKNESDVEDIYSTLDSPDVSDKAKDYLFGVCNDLGIILRSPMLKRYNWSTSLRMADAYARFASDYKDKATLQWLSRSVKDWKQEIEFMDQVILQAPRSRNLINNAMLTAMLVSCRKRPTQKHKMLEFWDKYFGIEECGTLSPPARLMQRSLKLESYGQGSGSIKVRSSPSASRDNFTIPALVSIERYLMGVQKCPELKAPKNAMTAVCGPKLYFKATEANLRNKLWGVGVK